MQFILNFLFYFGLVPSPIKLFSFSLCVCMLLKFLFTFCFQEPFFHFTHNIYFIFFYFNQKEYTYKTKKLISSNKLAISTYKSLNTFDFRNPFPTVSHDTVFAILFDV